MVYESQQYGMVDLAQIVFIRREFLIREKKYLIIFQMAAGHVSWRYDTEAERDTEYMGIRNLKLSK